MPRVKGSTISHARHKKVLKEAKGYFGSKHRLYKSANEQVMHSGKYAFRDRKQKKREFRKLWIIRINAACRENDISYSKFINGLSKAEITVNRKMLSEVAIDHPETFKILVELAKQALSGTLKDEVVTAPKVKEEKKVEPVKEEAKKAVEKKETTKKAVEVKKVAEKKPATKKVAEKKETVKKTAPDSTPKPTTKKTTK